jgi:glycosyltransferase involved in cell wall biosynthesis
MICARQLVDSRTTLVLINPFPWSRANGVTSYVRNALAHLRRTGIRAVCISNDLQLARGEFQRFVRDTLVSRFDSQETIVEAPELKAPTLLLPSEYRVHVRLHCPNALVEAYNGWAVNWSEFAEEMDVVRKARAVSSPSYALLRALDGHLDASAVHVYKNPPPLGMTSETASLTKGRDLVFLSRFMRSKGTDAVAALLGQLPESVTVALAGRDSDRFGTPRGVRCAVAVHGEIIGPARMRLLGEARVSLVLSRFENCSMTILESLAVGTVVVGWRVGGSDEIASSRLIRLVPRDDIASLLETIAAAREEPYPSHAEFRAAVASVADDFRSGSSRLLSTLLEATPVPVYRGLDCGQPARGRHGNDVMEREWCRQAEMIAAPDAPTAPDRAEQPER